MNKFNLGETVWMAQNVQIEKRVVCPECCGKKYVTVIFGDDSKATIHCTTCAYGYEPPNGYITLYEYKENSISTKITKIAIDLKEIHYSTDSGYYVEESHLFTNKEDADKKAKELSFYFEKEEAKKLLFKDKINKTWAQNACYHKKEIRQLEKSLVYHKAKLDVAKEKSKDEFKN